MKKIKTTIKKNKITQAVILCGGYGKRLGKITLKTPKPLIKVKKFTVLDYIMKNLTRFGVNDIILLCHYKFKIFKKKYHNRNIFGANVFCINEKTSWFFRSIIQRKKKLDKNFILCNGDTFFDINISDLIFEFFKRKKFVQIALKKSVSRKRYDTFSLKKDGQITEDIDKKYNLINSGILVVSKKILPYLEKRGH